jgi:hypothetical protein
MGLMPAYFTSTSYKKTRSKMTKSKATALVSYNRERKRLGLEPLSTMITPKGGKNYRAVTLPTAAGPYRDPERDLRRYPSLVSDRADTTKAVSKQYTGSAIVGIATLHKSNAVPVFSQQDAIDISHMRR